MGLGELGMSISELYELSVHDFHLKLEGFREFNNIQSREEWERTRKLAFYIVRMNTDKKNLTEYHIMQFPWDKEKPKTGIGMLKGEEQQKALKALVDNHQNVWKNFIDNRKN